MLCLICCFTCHMICSFIPEFIHKFIWFFLFVPPPPFFFFSSICIFTAGVVCVMSCDSPPPPTHTRRDLPEDLCPVYRPGEWEQLPSERELNPFSRYEALNPKRPIVLDDFGTGKLFPRGRIKMTGFVMAMFHYQKCLCCGISHYFLSLLCF